MKVTLGFVAIAVVLFASSCASTVRRGVVAMKMSDKTAHVGIGSKEVAVGDHVELYRNQCRRDGAGREGGDTSCAKKSLGHGTITKVLSGDYAEVDFDSGVEFKEGDMIEKHAH